MRFVDSQFVRVMVRPTSVLLAGLVVALLTGWTAYSLEQQFRQQQQAKLELRADAFKRRIFSNLSFLLSSFERMGLRWREADRTDEFSWRADAQAFLRHRPEIEALVWMDSRFVVQRFEGQGILQYRLNQAHDISPQRKQLLAQSSITGEMEFSPLVALEDGALGIEIYAPIQRRDGSFDGFLLMLIRVDVLLQEISQPDFDAGYYAMAIAAGEVAFSNYGNGQGAFNLESLQYLPSSSFALNLDNDDEGWDFHIWMRPGAVPITHTFLPELVLLAGFALAALVVLVLSLLRTTMNRENILSQLNDKLEKQIAERRSVEAQLRKLANFDELTGLPNRHNMQETLRRWVKNAERSDNCFYLLFIDLDRFKDVNDTLGHITGDQLLRRVAQRIKPIINQTDELARIGGDEFVVVSAIDKDDAIRVLAHNLLEAFQHPISLDEQRVYLSCSIGIAAFPEGGKTPQELISHADAALYQAKDAGRNTYRVFDAALHEKLSHRVELTHDLRHAIQSQQFQIWFQPKISLRHGRIVGAEALIRWNDPQRGYVPPGDFIGLTEENGMIIELGRWILQSAALQFKEVMHLSDHPLVLSINVSGFQLRDPRFVHHVEKVLALSGLHPDQIELELTEQVLIENVVSNRSMLDALTDLGVSLSIDDFGVGYSSLAYLKNFPVAALKIDRSFVKDLGNDPDDEDITSAIIEMAKRLNITVIAEGVETEDQLQWLLSAECEQAQGFLFSTAVPASKWPDLLEEDWQTVLDRVSAESQT